MHFVHFLKFTVTAKAACLKVVFVSPVCCINPKSQWRELTVTVVVWVELVRLKAC